MTVVAGFRAGRLTAKAFSRAPSGRAAWLCVCDCGCEKIVPTHRLTSGNTRSCGCLHKEQLSARRMKHGARTLARREDYDRTYNAWKDAQARVNGKTDRDEKYYAARGIKMCDRWRGDYAAFLSDMGPCPENHSLDREDNSGHYTPGNCRWVRQVNQVRNRRITLTLRIEGRDVPLARAARKAGVAYGTARARYEKGLPLFEILRAVQ